MQKENQDQPALFNIFNVVLKEGQKPATHKIFDRYFILAQIDVHLWQLVIYQTFEDKEGFFEANHLVCVKS